MEKDLSMLKINEITSISEAEKEFSSICKISVSPLTEDTPWKHHNSVHLCASFHPGTTCMEARTGLERLLNSLAHYVGIYRGRFFVVGILLQEEPGYLHAHLAVKSPKSRKTGKTVARIKEHLPAVMAGVADSAVRSFTLEPIHDLEGVFAYITGPRNLSSPSTVKAWKINQ